MTGKSKIIFLVSIFFLSSCQKNGDVSSPEKLNITWEIDKTADTQAKPITKKNTTSEEDEEIEDDGEGTMNLCAGNGGTVRVGHSWILATCKSNCTKGIGFRCGGYDYFECANGTRFYFTRSGNRCPVSVINPNSIGSTPINTEILSKSNRDMVCSYEFYSDNTMKIIFEKAIPKEEDETNELEIEVDDLFPLHKKIRIGGKRYKGYQVQTEKYKINRKDGKFGSAIIPIKLIS